MAEMNFDSINDLLNANMDDLADLPPMGVPPSGCYTLEVAAELKKAEGGGQYIKFEYVVVEVLELKDDATAGEVKAGQKFSEMFSPMKKDGTVNEMGIGFLKERLKPYAAHFGTSGVGDTLAEVKKLTITAEVVRRPARKEGERDNMSLNNVVVL